MVYLRRVRGLSPPSPIRFVVKLPLSVCALFAFAVDGFSPVFVAVVAVSVAHLIFVGEFSAVIAVNVFIIYDFLCF